MVTPRKEAALDPLGHPFTIQSDGAGGDQSHFEARSRDEDEPSDSRRFPSNYRSEVQRLVTDSRTTAVEVSFMRYLRLMRRARSPMVALAISGILVAAAVVISLQLGSAPRSYIRPPLFCAANGMALNGSDLWVSGCVFRTRSDFSARIPAVIELDIKTGSLIRVIKDRHAGNDGPVGIAVSSGRVWVANGDGNSILELSAATGMKI
jgi:hypothetical protein